MTQVVFGCLVERFCHTQHGYRLDAIRTFVQQRRPDDAPGRTAHVHDRHADDGSVERASVPRRRRTRGAAPLRARIFYAAHRNARCGDSVAKAVQGQPRCHAELNPVRTTKAEAVDSLINPHRITRQGVQGGLGCYPHSPAEPLDGNMGRRCQRVQVRRRLTLKVLSSNIRAVRPERWENVPEAAHALPSVYGHLMTFIAGAHSCIGFRFSVVECVVLILISCQAIDSYAITIESKPFCSPWCARSSSSWPCRRTISCVRRRSSVAL